MSTYHICICTASQSIPTMLPVLSDFRRVQIEDFGINFRYIEPATTRVANHPGDIYLVRNMPNDILTILLLSGNIFELPNSSVTHLQSLKKHFRIVVDQTLINDIDDCSSRYKR